MQGYAFREQNKNGSRNGLYFTLANRNTASDLAAHLPAARLHLRKEEL